MDSLSDRAAAIVGATILEARLSERLRHATPDLVIKERITLHDRMLSNAGPLGTLSARINLSFMLKFYGELEWRDLDLIRELRNDFSHLTAIGSFTEHSVRDRCANLKACDIYFTDPQKDNQSLTTQFVADNVGKDTAPKMTMYVRDLAVKLKDPRQRYLMCVMYYATFLKFPVVIQWGDRSKKPDPPT